MKFILPILGILILLLILKAFFSKGKSSLQQPWPDDAMPAVPKENDKLILVNGAGQGQIRSALTEFYQMYNENRLVPPMRLWRLSPNSFAITFPENIDFITYCFAVNHLKYPKDTTWIAQVKAWATTTPADDWITEKSVNKPVMLYVPDDDTDYDNVYLTTQDNIGYRLDFGGFKNAKLLTQPKEYYKVPAIAFDDLQEQSHEDFK